MKCKRFSLVVLALLLVPVSVTSATENPVKKVWVEVSGSVESRHSNNHAQIDGGGIGGGCNDTECTSVYDYYIAKGNLDTLGFRAIKVQVEEDDRVYTKLITPYSVR